MSGRRASGVDVQLEENGASKRFVYSRAGREREDEEERNDSMEQIRDGKKWEHRLRGLQNADQMTLTDRGTRKKGIRPPQHSERGCVPMGGGGSKRQD